jgi:hypothetical protein
LKQIAINYQLLQKNAEKTISLRKSLRLNMVEAALIWAAPMAQTVRKKSFKEEWILTV